MVAQALETRLHDMVSKVQSVVDLDTALADITQLIGFQYFALSHHVDICKSPGNAIRLHNYPASWVENYDKRALGVVDPVHRASHATALGFPWSRLPWLIPMTRNDKRMLEEGRMQGICDGFTVPVHMPGEARGTCTFATRAERPAPNQQLLFAQLAGTFAFETARRLWLKRGIVLQPRVPVLTDRQRDCVVLMAQGKTDREIAIMLGISRETVTTHITAACERYGIFKRQLLVTLTLYDGTLTFDDVEPWRYPHFLG